MNEQKGSTLIIALAVLGILILGGGAYYLQTERGFDEGMMEEDMTEHMEENAMMERDEANSMMEEGETMMDEMSMHDNFTGKQIAGNKSVLLEFNEADYQKAIAGDKLVVLFFYANWCPICKEEFPKFESAIEQLSHDGVVGFRVNFNDNETSTAEEALAREFGVAYQHTKVFIKNGERVLKAPDSWDEARYTSAFAQYSN